MYPTNNADEKYSAPTQPTAPPASIGIPVASTMQMQFQTPLPWSTGLCHCFDDFTNCCITCWCPCITFGRIAEIAERGRTSCVASCAIYMLVLFVTGCSWWYSCLYRSKLRSQYVLEERPCNDCLVHCFCEYCALCQEYRELKNRGFDMALGWQGNLERQNRRVTEPPAIQPSMNR